jgi:hypothetical protein
MCDTTEKISNKRLVQSSSEQPTANAGVGMDLVWIVRVKLSPPK